MLTPVGFWSYARQDDNHSDGQLSELRAVVGKAINLHRGEEVRLFQDTEAIPNRGRLGSDDREHHRADDFLYSLDHAQILEERALPR